MKKKIFLFVILTIIAGCGYQPIYVNKDVKNTMGRMTNNLRSNKQFKQQEARREKLDFERYDPMDGALQLYKIIKPYEELFKLQYFNVF